MLRDLAPFAQVKKLEKHSRRSVTFSKAKAFFKFLKHHIDIWQGPNAFELVDVSYYKEV